MRITVEISEDDLNELMKITGEKKKSTAVAKGVSDLIKQRKMAEFGRLLREGAFDFEYTNDEIERMGL